MQKWTYISDSELTDEFELLMKRGNYREHQKLPRSLHAAIALYREAFSLLAGVRTPALPERPRLLGLARMNEGNAAMKLGQRDDLAVAIKLYHEAIEWFEKMPSEKSIRDRNTLGAAWLNLGHAHHTLGDADSIDQAIHAFQKSTEILRELSRDDDPWFRVNLTGALMNGANAWLSRSRSTNDLMAAYAEAGEALKTIEPLEEHRADAADLGLKARRVLCDAIGQILPRARSVGLLDRDLAAEASDAVDSGLTLLKKWPQFARRFEPIALRLFRFGTVLYRINQPHFLAEFIGENLSLAQESILHRAEWIAVAAEGTRDALNDLKEINKYTLDDPESERRLQTAKDLGQLEKQIKSLQSQTPAGESETPRRL